MRFVTRLFVWLTVLLISQTAFSQPNRIKYNNQELFLSGANLAWVSFARDIGPGPTDLNTFADVLLQIHDHGGNALRWWLHTNGTSTPDFNDAGFVIGPGVGTIEDMRKVLDLAWEREIGVKLCLWSFDMLRRSNSPIVLNRNRWMLTDTNYTRAYINNSLIPMVDSLKRHPAIVAWEIFNEPEGMSNEFGWSDIQHVPMSAIQRFINLCAGAIHRTDSTALVTSGAWSFYALTDVPLASILAKTGTELTQLSTAEKKQVGTILKQKYRSSLTPEEIILHLEKIAAGPNQNYYSDGRLIAAGGDSAGTLDFYSVHYYSSSTPISTSPFHNPAVSWGLNKPIVVAEFAMESGRGNPPNIPKASLYDTLYHLGYAGALAWSWIDANISSHEDMLAAMQYMWDNYREAVDVQGIGGDWPIVTITNPKSDTAFADGAEVPIEAVASDRDGSVVLVEFFANDAIRIGERNTAPYTITWTNITPGDYTLTAVATDNHGHKRTSNRVSIKVGTPTVVRLEAENAARSGTPTVLSDATASNGACLRMQQTGTITWTLPNVPAAGNYEIVFGYRLPYDTPKNQYINVNGVRVTEVVFDGNMNVWLEKKLSVNLAQGNNVIQMELSWGWMDLDYMAVPSSIVTSVESLAGLANGFSLEQNYPNPFNPTTTIRYSLPKSEHVRLAVYDILGRQVATLIDEKQNAGVYEVPFSAGGGSAYGGEASALASGVYFYRLEAGSFVETKKMILLR